MKKIIKCFFVIVLNNILICMIFGFLWYKLGLCKTTINMSSGFDTLKIVFLKYKYIYFFIIGILEFMTIIILKDLFYSKKICIIYYIVSLILSILLYLYSSFGYSTGLSIDNFGEEIKNYYIFFACLGSRYTSWIFNLNIPTLMGLIYVNIKNK